MLAALPRELRDGGIVPVDALHGIEVVVVRLARIGGGCPAALEHVVAGLHVRLVGDQPAARRRIGETPLLLVERQAPQLPPRRQHVEGQIGLQRENGVDRARRGLAPHPGAGRGALVQIVELIGPRIGLVALAARKDAEHHRPSGLHRHLLEPGEESALRLAAGDVGADLEHTGVQVRQRAHQAIELRPVGDPARHGRVVGRDVGRRPRAREAHGAGAHGFLHRGDHAGQVVLGRLLGQGAPAHDVHAQRGMADVRAVVDRLRQPVDGRQILGEGFPGPVDAGQYGLGRNVFHRGQAAGEPFAIRGPAGRQGEPAIPHDHGGDAVPAGAAPDPVPRHLSVHMGVAVDEARRDDQAVGVDGSRGHRPDASDLDDLAILDPDITPIACGA